VLEIGVFVPSNLSKESFEIVSERLDDFIEKAEVHISFYRTSDIELLKYLLHLEEELLEKVHIHIFSNIRLLDNEVEDVIKFLAQKGLVYKEHLLPKNEQGESGKSYYDLFLREMLRECDEVVSFSVSDVNQISKIYRPLDIAKEHFKEIFEVELDDGGKIKKL